MGKIKVTTCGIEGLYLIEPTVFGDEGDIMWNDPENGSEWPIDNDIQIILSDKDKK